MEENFPMTSIAAPFKHYTVAILLLQIGNSGFFIRAVDTVSSDNRL
jgi:hypothetical protein